MKHKKETSSSIYKHQCFDMLHTVHLFTQFDVMIAIYQQFKSQKLCRHLVEGSRRTISFEGCQTKGDVVFASPPNRNKSLQFFER